MMWLFANWRKLIHRCEPMLPGLLVSGIVVGLSSLGAFDYLENRAGDELTRWRGEQPWNNELVVIGIDDPTLRELGVLPLARRYFVDLLEFLDQANTRIVVLDILMTDESPEDEDLARAMRSFQNNAVVLAGASNGRGELFLKPSQTLLDASMASGHINDDSDNDGITRKHSLYIPDNESLAVSTAQAYSLTTDLINLPPGPVMHINWPGDIHNLSYASFLDVLDGKVPADRFQNKVVFIGSTATGQDQKVRTPFNTKHFVGGVYAHAAVMHNLLEQNWLRVPDRRWVILLILVAGPLMSWGLKDRSFLEQVAIWGGCVTLWILLAFGVRYQNIVLPVATPIILFSLTEGLMVFTDRLRSSAILQARNEFLGTMSHELRTPLNAIIGVSEMMQETHLDPRQREFSETIQNSSQALLALINDVLDFSKIEAGRLVLEEHPVNLRSSIEESLDIVATRAAHKPLDLVYMMDPQTPPVVISDPIRLRQILLNLLSNAVKFTDQGEVAVIVQPAPNDDLGLPVTRWQHPAEESILLLFAVRDTGIGIPEDRLAQIFEPFRQASSSTTRKYGGTGLGLTISKRLAETMGGRLWVESELNQGSTFFFTIRAQVEPVIAPSEHPEALSLWANHRLLVVDKNSTRRTGLGWQLATLAIEPVFTRSVAEALLLVQQGQQFDAVLLDAEITKIDPVTAIDSLRQAMEKPALPLILLAGLKENLNQDGRPDVAVIWKPIKQAALYRALMTIHPMAPPSLTTVDAVDVSINATNAKAELTNLVEPEVEVSSLKVLIADDNPVNQRVAQHMLQLLGYQADTVATGCAAIAAVEEGTYDVILMDMRMPQMSGLEATRRIRQMGPKIPQPWIIAMTANASSEDRARCLKVGMNDYVSKPIRRDNLSRIFQNIEQPSAESLP